MLSLVLGCVILFSSVQRAPTDVMIAYIVGFDVVLYGVVQAYTGCKAHKAEEKGVVLKYIWGAVCVITGLVLVAHPVFAMISVGYIIAFIVLSQGIGIIIIVGEAVMVRVAE